ncbi:hypothetical protein CAEBREN_25881 [Caenorhabditis brenneri]|uniref:SCP domain-containing protein n=1 Tax=Caenorhabditis brenneri TaxID=135651 RepID=G0MRV5_CAEBE|nr:hypothetical protein CAEBREN_25881 [Caenorhabditis brenneri]
MKFALICFAFFGVGLAEFSPEGQDAIVQAHNTLRSAVANGNYLAKQTPVGPASNMRKMSWDDELAKAAQTFADTCPSGHVEGKKDYGENLYWGYSSRPINELDSYAAKATEKWEGEFKKFGWLTEVYKKETKKFGIGHATQMIWSESNLVGCGVKSCGKGGKKNMYQVSVVCHYKKRGNYLNTNIFNKGESCSQCPSGTNCEKDTGLCV